MEENNNKNNKIKKFMKDSAKSIVKAIPKKLKIWIIIGIIAFLGILLAVGFLNILEYKIKSMFTNLVTTTKLNTEETLEGTPEATDSLIYIDKNGYYKLKEEYSELILEKLKEQKVDNKIMGFDLSTKEGEKLFRDTVDKYIKVEVATTFPKTGRDLFSELFGLDDVEGSIVIKRAETESGETKLLKYKKYTKFKKEVEAGNTEALTWFSMNPKNLKLCIARKADETLYFKVDANGNETPAGSEGGGLAIDELKYQTLIENYAVPLNYLLTMHIMALDSDNENTQDIEFMNELVDLAIGKKNKEPLVLTYVDSQQEYITEYEYKGTVKEIVTNVTLIEDDSEDDSEDEGSSEDISGPSVGDIYTQYPINNDNIKEYYNDAVDPQKTVTKTYSGVLYLSKADTWLKTFEKEINRLPDEKIEKKPSENELTDLVPKTHTYTLRKMIVETLDKIEDAIEYETPTTINREFQTVENNSKIIIDEFIELIEKYPNVKENLTSAPSNIFYLLEQNENTQKLEKIMRYVLFKLNDINYGALWDDIQDDIELLLEDEPFIRVSGGIYNGDTIEERTWITLLSAGYSKESAAAIMGNIYGESGFKTERMADKYAIGRRYSTRHTDKSYTRLINEGLETNDSEIRENFIKDNIGYGLLQWTLEGDKTNLYDKAFNSDRYIDNWDVQLEYLVEFLKGQDSAWKSTSDVKEAAKQLCKDIVDPGAVEDKLESDAEAAQKYYDEFKDFSKKGGFTVGNVGTGSTGDYGSTGDSGGSGGTGVVGGTLYSGKYVSTTGREFTLLDQTKIKGWGLKCNRAAAAIIASGYTQQDASTLVNVMNTQYAQGGDTIVPTNKHYWNLYGLDMYKDTQTGTKYYVEQQSDIIDNLKNGGYAMIWLNNGGRDYYGKSGEKWTKNIHWVAILEYNEESQQILVADHRGAGWYDIDEFKHGIWRYALIREMN